MGGRSGLSPVGCRSLSWRLHLVVVLSLAIAVAVPALPATAATGDELRPNLQALPASDLRISYAGGQKLLRFTTITSNVGHGPLELRAVQEFSGGKQRVDQRVYLEGGGYVDTTAGYFEYHSEHQHFHFEGYARYELQLDGAPGQSLRTGSKVTFCVIDTVRIDTRLPGAPKKKVYSTCGNQVQGLSVGWGDKYGYWLAGQALDVTGLGDGTYVLRITVDPNTHLRETDDGDNVSTVRLKLAGDTVTVLK